MPTVVRNNTDTIQTIRVQFNEISLERLKMSHKIKNKNFKKSA